MSNNVHLKQVISATKDKVKSF
uniref:Uncharacterized protein n=1 Tax=Anguilla anguilla TaxID=7936 RepID=A0A0E9U8X7_ANGAN